MEHFLFNVKSKYQFDNKLYELALDINDKTEKITNLKANSLFDELLITRLKNLVIGKSLSECMDLNQEILNLTATEDRFFHVLHWLFYKNIDSYLGRDKNLQLSGEYLCLCFGVTKADITKDLLANSNLEMLDIVKSTKATTGCGSCKKLIEDYIELARSQNGIIKGLDHSKSLFDSEGKYIKIKGMYPAELLIYIDEKKIEFLKKEKIKENIQIEIKSLVGHHIHCKVTGLEIHSAKVLLEAMQFYFQKNADLLIFCHLID